MFFKNKKVLIGSIRSISFPSCDESETHFDAASDGASGDDRNVVGLAHLMIEQILTAKAQRDSAREIQIERSAQARDAVVVAPVGAKL